MKGLTIYFGDLTHDTVGLATEVFPLNVGLVAAYCARRHAGKVDVRLFKYIHHLERAIQSEPPDILALSNYPWTHNVDMALFQVLSDRRPEALRVMGGPNFPHNAADQEEFLKKRPLLDAYVYLDGEVGFANVVESALAAQNLAEARRRLRAETIAGTAQLSPAGKLLAEVAPLRLRELDEIPSPYLTGLLDPFFDGRLSPMMQTNRGCPFRCTFCHDGTEKVSKINQFSMDRVKADLRYIAARVPESVKTLFISDLNFGMYPRDQEICAEIAQVKAERGFPLNIDTTTGKNSKERVIQAIEQLDGALRLTMSVQSLDENVLLNIKRDNIRLADFLALQPAIRRSKLPTISEVILGLPGETYASHVKTLGELLDAEMDSVVPYTLMMVNGSELATAAERRKWGFKTKYRVIPRDFTQLLSGRKVMEVEEVVVETNTLPFADYVKARKLAFILQVTTNFGFRPLVRYFNSRRLPVIALVERLLARLDGGDAPRKLLELVGAFAEQTKTELWDSEEEIIAFFQDDAHFQGLIDGVHGANLMQLFHARSIASAMDEWVAFIFSAARPMVEAKVEDAEGRAEFDEIERYLKAKLHNLLGPDRQRVVPEAVLSHDIDAWALDPMDRPLSAHSWDAPHKVRFVVNDQQYRAVERYLDQFGHNDQGRAKTLIRISAKTLWRNAVPAGKP